MEEQRRCLRNGVADGWPCRACLLREDVEVICSPVRDQVHQQYSADLAAHQAHRVKKTGKGQYIKWPAHLTFPAYGAGPDTVEHNGAAGAHKRIRLPKSEHHRKGNE